MRRNIIHRGAAGAPVSACAVVALLLGTGTALAEMTPRHLWDSWKALGARSGQSFTAAESTLPDGALELRDLTAEAVLPDGVMESRFDVLRLSPLPQGGVSIEVPARYEMSYLPAGAPEAGRLDFVLENDGLVTTAQGDAALTRYEIAARSLTLASVPAKGGAMPPVGLAVTLGDLSGHYTLQQGGIDGAASELSAARAELTMTSGNPDGGPGSAALTARYEGVRFSADGGPTVAEEDLSQALFGGTLMARALMSHAGGSFELDYDGGTGPSRITGTSKGGTLETGFEDGALRYGARSEGVALELRSERLGGAPITGALDSLRLAAEIPVAEGAEPAPFSLLLDLAGLELSDPIWSVIDPSRVLPRDPARLLVELDGTARVTGDLSDPAALARAEPPLEPRTLELRDLALSVAGAELTGTGTLRFDPADKTSYPGFPAPLGAVQLWLKGGAGLIENLAAMGIIPPGQAMGAQMMLGMFAVPAETPDTLRSRLEFGPGGTISANGQRLR